MDTQKSVLKEEDVQGAVILSAGCPTNGPHRGSLSLSFQKKRQKSSDKKEWLIYDLSGHTHLPAPASTPNAWPFMTAA
jgi:hypothetical protein